MREHGREERCAPRSDDRVPAEGHVILTGHIDVPADRLDAIRAALPDHIRLTLAEPGCLGFEVRESHGTPGRFEVRERFADAQAFRAHQARVQSSDWGRISAGLPRHYTVTGLKP
jgi:quinol monooxygenase YgiN